MGEEGKVYRTKSEGKGKQSAQCAEKGLQKAPPDIVRITEHILG